MITSVRLQNFRSYTDESFEFDPSVNIVVGPNASGKTNLLESIMVSCLGTSYRVKDIDLVAFNAPWARIDAMTEHGVRSTKLIVNAIGVKKEFIIQEKPVQRLTLPKTIPVVLFEPNHLLLLTGLPDVRREYIDNLIEQLVVGYGALRRQYKRTLAQRNRLLKQGKHEAGPQIFAWNIRLSQLGGEIVAERLRVMQQMSEGVEPLYQQLSQSKESVGLTYVSGCDVQQYSSDMLHKLEQNLEQDLERGFTSYGPHRDDLVVTLQSKPIQSAASRGETRTLLLALKILEVQLIEKAREQKPILLLDDVFSELDGARRRALTETLTGYQTFITTTDADVVVDHFMGTCNVIPLKR